MLGKKVSENWKDGRMDRLEAMQLLLTVAEQGSLSAAGRHLRLPLSTVSRRISDLEAHLSARLLVRSSRRVELTEAGQAYVAASRRILDQVAEAERAASGEYAAARGELVITAPMVFGRLHVLPVVTAFLRAQPEVTVRLILADRVLHLHDDHVDVALRIGALPDSSLIAVRIGAIRRVICASPAYLGERGVPVVPDDLIGHDCITFSGGGIIEGWRFAAGGQERTIAVRARLVVNTAEAAIDAAVAGLGLTRVLSYQIAAPLAAGLLVRVLDDADPGQMPVSLVHAGQGPLPQKLRAFLDFAAPRLRAGLAAAA
jgi:DNA-binding transcriptional LysR family regulator